MKRKLLSALMALCMVLTLVPVTALADEGRTALTDVDGHWAESSITRWVDSGVVQGSNGRFDPNGALTCGQLATILSNLLKLGAAGDAGFTDSKPGAWYYDAINRCAAAGILNGNGDGTVDPNGTISRERAMVMLGRALSITPKQSADLSQYGDGAQVAGYAGGMVAALIEAGIVSGVGDNRLAPQEEINRASAMTILDRAIGAYADKSGASVSGKGGITLVVADGVTVTGEAGRLLVSADNIDVLLTGGKTADHVAITGDNSSVTLKSTGTESATLSGENSKLILESANAGAVKLDGAKSEVETKGTAKIDSVSLTENAAGATVNAGKGSTIGSVENDAKDATVSGSGTVGEVKSSEDVTIETKDTDVKNTGDGKITVSDGAGKDTSVSGGGTTTTGSTTSGTSSSSSSGSSHSHRYSDEWTYDETDHWHAATCGHSAVSGKAAHSWDAGEVTKEATCTESGVKTYTCTVCGAAKTEEIPMVEHTWDAGEVTKEATELENGEMRYTCTVCGATKTEAIVKTGEHTLTHHDAAAADCGAETNGKKEYWECTGCGKKFSDGAGVYEVSNDTLVIPWAHTEQEIPAVAPTCTEDGLTAGVACSVCHQVLTAQEEIPALGHDFDEDGKCTVCGFTKCVEVWTGYSGTKVGSSYATIEEAAANLGENKWIVISGDYTLDKDFTIADGVYLDVAAGGKMTVADGVTLTLAADSKRLGVRANAEVVNNGTILVCGTSYSNGYFMQQGTLSGNALSVPEGYFLDNNGNNYFATADANALYEITFADGSVKKTADSTNIKGGNVTQIKLLNNVEKALTLDNSVGPEVVLDLNGHTISYNGANRYYATLNIYTKVIIKNGTVSYTGTERGAIDLVGSGDLTIDSTATIDGGSSFGIFTSGSSKLTVNGTVTAAGNYAIAGNGSKTDGEVDNCNITVNDGAVVSAANGIGIYHPQLGTVTVNGGTITGHTGVQMCAGKLVVKGGEIKSTGDNEDRTGSQNAMPDGAAVSIVNRNYPGGTPEASISGGTFTASGEDALAVKAYDYTGNQAAEWADAAAHVSITGGTFSSDPSAYVDTAYYKAEADASGTSWTVSKRAGTEDDPYLISTGEQAYYMRNYKGYFKLVEDVVVTNEISLSKKTVVVDLNGHSIKLEYADDVEPTSGGVFNISGNKGKLTINDSSEGQTGKVIGSDKTYANKVTSAVRVGNYGKLTINGGHFYGTSEETSCIFVYTNGSSSSKATVTINGGTFETASPLNGIYYVLNHQDSLTAGCTITVNGGTFKNYNPGVTAVDPVNAKTGKIALGTGCTTTQSTEGGDTWYTVSKNA